MAVVADSPVCSRPRGRRLASPAGRNRGRSAPCSGRSVRQAQPLENRSAAIAQKEQSAVAPVGATSLAQQFSPKECLKRAQVAQSAGSHVEADGECTTALQRFRPDEVKFGEDLLAELLLVRAVSRAALNRWVGALSDSDRALKELNVPWEDVTPLESPKMLPTAHEGNSYLPSSILQDSSTIANQTEGCSAVSTVKDRFVGRDLLVLQLLVVEIRGTWRSKLHPRLQVAICRLLALDSRVPGAPDWNLPAFAMVPRIALEAVLGRFPQADKHLTALLHHLLEAPERIASFLGAPKALALLLHVSEHERIGAQDLAMRALTTGLCRCEKAFDMLPKLRLFPSLLKRRSEAMGPYLRFLLTVADRPLGRRMDLTHEEVRSLLDATKFASGDSVIAAILLSCRWLPQGARETEHLALSETAVHLCDCLCEKHRALDASGASSSRCLEEGFLVQAFGHLRRLLSARLTLQAEPLQRGVRYESAVPLFKNIEGAAGKVATAIFHAIRFVNNAWPRSLGMKPRTRLPKCSESNVLEGFSWVDRAMDTDLVRQLLFSWLLDFTSQPEHCKLLLDVSPKAPQEIIDFWKREMKTTGAPEILRLLLSHGWLHSELAMEGFLCEELLSFCDCPDSSTPEERRELVLALTLLVENGGVESRRWAEKFMLCRGVARTLHWADLQVVQPEACYVLLRSAVVHGGLPLALEMWSQRRSCFESTQVLEKTLCIPQGTVTSPKVREWQHLCLTVIKVVALHNGFQGSVRAVSIESILPAVRGAAKALLPGSAETLEALLLERDEPATATKEVMESLMGTGQRRWVPMRLHSSAVGEPGQQQTRRNLVQERTDVEKADVFDTSLACAAVCEWSEKKRALRDQRMVLAHQPKELRRKVKMVYPHTHWRHTAKFLVSSPTKQPGTYAIDPFHKHELNDTGGSATHHTYEDLGRRKH